MPPAARLLCLKAAAVGLGTLLAATGLATDLGQADLRRGALPWLLALLAWGVVSSVLAPFRAFAFSEMLRLTLCAEVCVAAAYGLRPDQVRPLVGAVLAGGAAVGVGGVIQFGATERADEVTSLFGNHEQLGSFLALMLPVALALGLSRRESPRAQIAMQVVALIVGATLLLARTRSAWAGGAAGLVLLSLLALRAAPVRLNPRNKSLIIGPLLVVFLAFAGFVVAGQVAPLVSRRAATLVRVVDDGSFQDRLHRWQSACRMAAARPVAGWGLGSFPVLQQGWTHQGDPPAEVLARGTGHQNLAHNFWAQWAAETGLVGLFLYVGAVAAFVIGGVRALRVLRPGRNHTVLMGCVAATVGGCVDAIGAPSYTFPGVSALFWLWIGVGIAASRAEGAPASPAPRRDLLGAVLIGLAAAAVVLAVGHLQ